MKGLGDDEMSLLLRLLMNLPQCNFDPLGRALRGV